MIADDDARDSGNLQEKISEYARTVEARHKATHLLINFLLFANGGALLIVFTFAGVLITGSESQPVESVPALLTSVPASFFALGVIFAGFAVFKLDRIRETYMSDAEKALNIALRADGRLGDFQMRKSHNIADMAQDKFNYFLKQYDNLIRFSFTFFLIGTFLGFVGLSNISTFS